MKTEVGLAVVTLLLFTVFLEVQATCWNQDLKPNPSVSVDRFASTGHDSISNTYPWGDWEHYHNYSEIVNTLLNLNLTYPHIADVFSIGKSWQNRDIYCIRLTNETITQPKPEVLFIGYHHARELISAELPLYFAVEVATNYGTNETITHMLDHCEVYIVPALNVDGFDFVQANEWQRKNVHPFDEDGDGLLDEDPPEDEDGDGYIEGLWQWDGSQWIFVRWEGVDDDGDDSLNEDWTGGVDLNRNYGYEWNATVQSGSTNPGAEDYRGPAPFSEPETQVVRDLALQHNFRYAISFHSGADCIVYPWGHTTDLPPDNDKFVEIADDLSQLVGCWHGQGGEWYTTSGVWDDWMYGNRSILAFTCEIYLNSSAWQYEPGPYPDSSWEKGVFQFFNPDPSDIESAVQRWSPVFTYLINRAIAEGPPVHDVATTRIDPAKTIVGQGFSMTIDVTVTNQGNFSETFNVTAYADKNATVIGDETTIDTTNVTLASGNSQVITFVWNTTGVANGSYTLGAVADTVLGETSTVDNVYTGATVIVALPCDIAGSSTTPPTPPDYRVDYRDLFWLLKAYGSDPADPNWDPNLDFTGSTTAPPASPDDKVDYMDLFWMLKYYGEPA